MAKEPQKSPLFWHAHLSGGAAWPPARRSPCESSVCKIFIDVKRSLIFHGKNMPPCSLSRTKLFLITILHYKTGLFFIFIIILQELFKYRDITLQIIMLYQNMQKKLTILLSSEFSLCLFYLILKWEDFPFYLGKNKSFFTRLFILSFSLNWTLLVQLTSAKEAFCCNAREPYQQVIDSFSSLLDS